MSEHCRECAGEVVAGGDTPFMTTDQATRVLLENAADAFYVIEPHGSIVDVNRTACGYLGYARDELIGMPIWDVVEEFSPDRFADRFNELLAHGPQTVAVHHRRKDGSLVPVECRACVLELDGRSVLFALARDVTDRRKGEAALQESKERFRLLVEHAADAFYVLETDGRVVDVNQRACESTGYTRHELLQMSVWDISEAMTPQVFARTVDQMAAGPLTVTSRHHRKDGTSFLVEVRARLFEASGRQCILALARDVTERVRAEEARRKMESRLARILESTMDAIVIVDSDQCITVFNGAAERAFRCAASEAVGLPFTRFLSAAFREVVEGYVSGAEGSAPSSMWLPVGLFALRADGEAFPIEGTLSRAEAGNETLLTIILRDINDRQQAEARLRQVNLEKVYLQEEIEMDHNFSEIVGTSSALRNVFDNVRQVSGTNSTVLITGETGTGKELIARAVHRASNRKDRVLVKVNCAALSPGLIESELFGHDKGAFTGALTRRIGRFELADGGTIFLDEIGDLPGDLQAKLLRVLQEGEFERVGGTRTVKVDVRVIAATNHDLEKAVQEGRFRADLYYRIKVFPIRIPPLRTRTEDIPWLVGHFVHKYATKLGKKFETVPQTTLAALTSYGWPGNVRELENVIERAVIISRENQLVLGDWREQAASVDTAESESLDHVQRHHITRVLQRTAWRVSGPRGAARILGMKPTTLVARMKKLGIQRHAGALTG